jgi:hypothetical protein
MTWIGSLLLALAATPTGDPLGPAKRAKGSAPVAANGAIETVMLLAQLATPAPPRSEFQARVRAKYAGHAGHPAVQETASLLAHGWDHAALARFAALLSQAPYFVLSDSETLRELAGRLPPTRDPDFHLDRLHGYAKLVREFYWDNHVGRFFRGSLTAYQQAVKETFVEPGAGRVVVSLLAPAERIDVTPLQVVLGSSDILPSAEPERAPPPARSARKSRTKPRPRPGPAAGGR